MPVSRVIALATIYIRISRATTLHCRTNVAARVMDDQGVMHPIVRCLQATARTLPMHRAHSPGRETRAAARCPGWPAAGSHARFVMPSPSPHNGHGRRGKETPGRRVSEHRQLGTIRRGCRQPRAAMPLRRIVIVRVEQIGTDGGQKCMVSATNDE